MSDILSDDSKYRFENSVALDIYNNKYLSSEQPEYTAHVASGPVEPSDQHTSILTFLSNLQSGQLKTTTGEKEGIQQILNKIPNSNEFILACCEEDFSQEAAFSKRVVFCAAADKAYIAKIESTLNYNNEGDSSCKRVRIGNYNFYYGYNHSPQKKHEETQLILSIYGTKLYVKLFISLVNCGGADYWEDKLCLLLDVQPHQLQEMSYDLATRDLLHEMLYLLDLPKLYRSNDEKTSIDATLKIKKVLRAFVGQFAPFINFLISKKIRLNKAKSFQPSIELLNIIKRGDDQKQNIIEELFQNSNDNVKELSMFHDVNEPTQKETGDKIKHIIGNMAYIKRLSEQDDLYLISENNITASFEFFLLNSFHILQHDIQLFLDILKKDLMDYAKEGNTIRASWGHSALSNDNDLKITVYKKPPVDNSVFDASKVIGFSNK